MGITEVRARAGAGDVILIDSFLGKAWTHYAPDATHRVVHLPNRDPIGDLPAWLSDALGEMPRAFWLLTRPSDTEDLVTREGALRRYRVDWEFETKTNVGVTRFVRRE